MSDDLTTQGEKRFFDFRSLSSIQYNRLFDIPYKFYTVVPTRFKPLYFELLQVRYWLGGSVPYIHNSLLSSRIIPTLTNIMTNKIMSGGYKYNGNKEQEDFLNKWEKKVNFSRTIRDAVYNAQAMGFSFIKKDIEDGLIVPTVVYADQAFFKLNRDKIVDFKCSTLYLEGNQEGSAIYKIEHRWYDEESGLPMIENYFIESNSQFDSGFGFNEGLNESAGFELAARKIKASTDLLARSGIPKGKINQEKENMKPKQLPMNSIGVYMIKSTVHNPKYIKFGIGESLTSQIGEDTLIRYEIATSLESHEMIVSPTLIMVPSEMENGKTGILVNGDELEYTSGLQNVGNKKQLNGTYYVNVPYQTPDGEKIEPKSIQFEIRSGNITELKIATLREISTAIGFSPNELESLATGTYQSKDATNKSITEDTINSKRDLVSDAVNQFAKDLLWDYGFEEQLIDIVWTNSQLDEFEKKVNMYSIAIKNFLMSQETAVKLLNKNMTQTEIDEELERIDATRKQIMETYYAGGSQDKADIVNGVNEHNDQVSRIAGDKQK